MHQQAAVMTARSAAGAVTPEAPSDPAAQQLSSTSIRVSWQDNSTNEDQFIIYRGVNGGSLSQHTTVGSNVTEFDDTGLTPGDEYTYEISAKNEFGESARTAAVSEVPEDATPNAPTGFSLSLATDRTELVASWSDNSDNEEGFKVIDEADSSVVEEVGANFTSTGLQDNDGIVPAKEYTMHVDAFNSGGSSSSNSDTQKTALIAPVLDLSVEGDAPNSFVVLQWTEPNDGAKRSEWGIYKNDSLIDTVPDSEDSFWTDDESLHDDGDVFHVTARGSFPESNASNKETLNR